MLGITGVQRVVCDSDHMSGGWWWAMGIGWLVFLAVVVGLVVLVVRRGPRATGPPRRSAHDVLDDRFARGEIDDAEYRSRRDALRGD